MAIDMSLLVGLLKVKKWKKGGLRRAHEPREGTACAPAPSEPVRWVASLQGVLKGLMDEAEHVVVKELEVDVSAGAPPRHEPGILKELHSMRNRRERLIEHGSNFAPAGLPLAQERQGAETRLVGERLEQGHGVPERLIRDPDRSALCVGIRAARRLEA